MIQLKVRTLPGFKGELPRYETRLASGMDVRAQLGEEVMNVSPGQRVVVPTGLSFEIPEGFEIQVRPRSGLAAKQGLTVLNAPGTIDADYRGELKVLLVNLGQEPILIRDQDRIAQLVLCPVIQCELVVADRLSETVRGEGGFGSTGVRSAYPEGVHTE